MGYNRQRKLYEKIILKLQCDFCIHPNADFLLWKQIGHI